MDGRDHIMERKCVEMMERVFKSSKYFLAHPQVCGALERYDLMNNLVVF